MMTTDQRLAYMAGQILRNFAARGQERAIHDAAEHLRLYWDPGMKARARAMLADPALDLPEGVREVFASLQDREPA